MLGLTGAESCLELVRQCWTNQPLTESERCRIENIILYSSLQYPSVTLLCRYLLSQTERMRFLFDDNVGKSLSPLLLRDAETMYLMGIGGSLPNNAHRRRLKTHEAMLGFMSIPVLNRTPGLEELKFKIPFTDIDYTKGVERNLLRFVQHNPLENPPVFPLDQGDGNYLKQSLITELKQSWGRNIEIPIASVSNQLSPTYLKKLL
jgi:hypothetical protein